MGLVAVGAVAASQAVGKEARVNQVLHTYTLPETGTPAAYDEAMAAACLQGLINRAGPELYVLSPADKRPYYWLQVLSQDGRWLSERKLEAVADLNGLVALAKGRVKGAVIWDPSVPATVDVATTIAGVEDGVVLSPEMADRTLGAWTLPVLADLRGRFTGAETGSAKNDAYRWAIREYLARGVCSAHLICLYEDAFSARAQGDVGYVVTRDWAVRSRAFVFDLSPWGDERPGDDPEQPLGTDLATYRLLLEEILRQSAGKQMTELAGFFAFGKYSNVPGHASAHDPVPTEWETVHLISPYNCYQNTVASSCFNQSLHCQAPRRRLKQHRPTEVVGLADRTYLCFLMADYDSATPLYGFLPDHWDDPNRGQIPLAWGIDPNLVETFPDLFSYFYATASANDYFTSDASAAGYMNPNRVQERHLPLFVRHNQRFFRETDMTIAPMVLDWDEPTPQLKDAFTRFAPDGLATIVMDLHGTGGRSPEPHVWRGMPVTNLINNACNFDSPEQAAAILGACLRGQPAGSPGFYLFRVVWTGPTQIINTVALVRQARPDLDLEVVDPYTFFRLFKEHEERHLSGGTPNGNPRFSSSPPSCRGAIHRARGSESRTPIQ
jgi:hypothetical protein